MKWMLIAVAFALVRVLIPTIATAAALPGLEIPVARELHSIAVNPLSDFTANGRSRFSSGCFLPMSRAVGSPTD